MAQRNNILRKDLICILLKCYGEADLYYSYCFSSSSYSVIFLALSKGLTPAVLTAHSLDGGG